LRIAEFQREVAKHIEEHNRLVYNKQDLELFQKDFNFLKSALQEDLEKSSFASLLVTLQALYNISELCAHYAYRYQGNPDYVNYFQQIKALAEEKFKTGYMTMLERAKAIYGEVAPIMLQKDEDAIRNISVPKSLKDGIEKYQDIFFKKVKSQAIDEEKNSEESSMEEEK
jgi:hypothetical protein